MKLSTKDLLRPDLIALACVLGVAGLGATLGVMPSLQAREDESLIRTELDEAHTRSVDLARSLADRRAALDAALASQRARPRIALSPPTRLNEHLARLAALCEDAGVGIRSINHGAPRTDTPRAHVPITISADADFDQLMDLLGRLHDGFQDTGVRSLTLTGAPEGAQGERARTEAVVELVWFVATDP